jgi:hypothetical protein
MIVISGDPCDGSGRERPARDRYASCGDVRIACRVVGDGPVDLVFVPGLAFHQDVVHESPG